jgi:hypothetical protein
VVERLAIGAGNKPTISPVDVTAVIDEIRRFEMPSDIPVGYREEDSLDEFLARTTLSLITISEPSLESIPKSHASSVSIEIRFTIASSERSGYYDSS